MKFKFTFKGQPPSGKNAIIITRTGKRFPSARFSKWKREVMPCLSMQLRAQGLLNFPLSQPCSVTIDYYTADKRRRDMPGIIDAIWHVLEKVGIVSDDTFLGGTKKYVRWNHLGLNKEKAGVTLTITTGD